jgi:ubiquinone/menaquinone biosynthesis C-methylase UbiE
MKKPYVCPAYFSGSLDNFFRRLVQDPRKTLDPFVREGMTVLDLGCGPGYFSLEIAKMIGTSGKLFAADIQPAMLAKLRNKIIGTDLEQRIELVECSPGSIGVSGKVDFILAFWMIHEVTDHERLFSELKDLLKPGGKILVVEPKIHVTGRAFEKMLSVIKMTGFEIAAGPKAFFSRSLVLSLA